MLNTTNAHGISALLYANAQNDANEGFSTLIREYVEALEQKIVASMSETYPQENGAES